MEEIWGNLPMELMIEVLAKLPVKTLVRFRCVSKAWHSLISSPEFASLHLTRYHVNHHKTHFLTASVGGDDCVGYYHWNLLSGHSYEDITGDDDYAIMSDRTIMDFIGDLEPYGNSVDGLVLVSTDVLMLWNPLIGKTHRLPYRGKHYGNYYGLGFSRLSNDYKVVAISTTNRKTSALVCSLRTGSWRSIVDCREIVLSEVITDGFYLMEGHVYFVSVDVNGENSHLVLFDVDDDVITYIECPSKGFKTYPVVFREKVGILDFDYKRFCCHLWVMEEDSVSGSWQRLHTVGFEACNSPSMLCFKENGEFMFTNERAEVELHDVKSGEVKHIRESSSCYMMYSFVYKESLMFL